jgi:hypothetical protein
MSVSGSRSTVQLILTHRLASPRYHLKEAQQQPSLRGLLSSQAKMKGVRSQFEYFPVAGSTSIYRYQQQEPHGAQGHK